MPVIGKTGRNFAAGMSGGIAYVYNKDGSLDKNCNKELVGLETLSEKDIAKLKEMLENHVKYTAVTLRKICLITGRKK